MKRSQLTSDDIDSIKTATRRLIRCCGGLESAATVSRVGKSSLSDYQNPELPDHFMPVDVVAELEKDSGQFHVTQALCRVAGGTFHREQGRAGQVTTDFSAHMPGVGESIGNVYREAALAMADGTLTNQERRELLRRLDECIGTLSAARNALDLPDGAKT